MWDGRTFPELSPAPRLRETSPPHHLTRPGLNNLPQRRPRGQPFENRLEGSAPTPGAPGYVGASRRAVKVLVAACVYLPPGKVPATRCRRPSRAQVQQIQRGKLLARRLCLYFPVSGPSRSVRSCSAALGRFLLLLLPPVLPFSAQLSAASCRCSSFTNLFPFRFAEASV